MMTDASNQPATSPPILTEDGHFQVELSKHGQRFMFRYLPGQEAQVMQQMLDLAADPESDFESFDAAVLSHQLGRRFQQQIQRLNKAS